MRVIALFILAVLGMLKFSLALVEARYRTTVDVWANAWDETGCPGGCTPDKTRDGGRSDDSRWSCAYHLEDEACEIWYSFAEPQDIVRIRLYLGEADERIGKIKMTFYDTDGGKSTKLFTSSGTTEGYESITVNTDETTKIGLTFVDREDDEWIHVYEVQFLVM